METYKKSPQFEKILEKHGKTVENMSKYVEILREWMKKQPHLPSELLSDDLLEITLIQNKLSVQKTKTKIENYCTYKSMKRFEYLFMKELFVLSKEPVTYIPIPKLTEHHRRIIISTLWDEEKYEMLRNMSTSCFLREIYSRYDYNDGEIHIVDYSRASMKFLTKTRPNVLIDGMNLITGIFSARIKEIHIISKIGHSIFAMAKPLLPSKIADRVRAIAKLLLTNLKKQTKSISFILSMKSKNHIHVFLHEHVDELKKFIPAKCLPLDYGGESKSLAELLDDYDDFMESHREELFGYLNTKSREDKRIEAHVNEQMDGTFVKLNID